MSDQNYESSRLLAEFQKLVEASEMEATIPPYVDDPAYIEHHQQFNQVRYAKIIYNMKSVMVAIMVRCYTQDCII